MSWRQLREAAGLSVRDLQDLTAINRGDLSKIENGLLAPTPRQAWRLLVALGYADA